MGNTPVRDRQKANKAQRSTSPAGARATALRILRRVEHENAFLDKVLETALKNGIPGSRDKALLTELVNGVTRHKSNLDWRLARHYHGKYRKCEIDVKNALRLALYQVLHLDKIPVSAAVNESVQLIKKARGPRAANLVNAVLRKTLADTELTGMPDSVREPAEHLALKHSHPLWLVEKWLGQFDRAFVEELLAANNRRPTLSLRLNPLKGSPNRHENWLMKEVGSFEPSAFHQHCVTVPSFPDLAESPAFGKGMFSVQDISAVLAARLTDARAGDRVVDLCAAPGGKSTAMAEMMQDNGIVISVDKYRAKLRLIESSATRLGLGCIQTREGDARSFDPGFAADIVLVDAPCSGLGTVAKRPDIKWKRTSSDIRTLTALQKEILANAARIVKPGGIVVYSTCTIEPEENTAIAAWFLRNFKNFVLESARSFLPEAVCSQGFLMTFPHVHGTDGAFAARFRRQNQIPPDSVS